MILAMEASKGTPDNVKLWRPPLLLVGGAEPLLDVVLLLSLPLGVDAEVGDRRTHAIPPAT